MSEMKIRSSIRDYEVFFESSISSTLSNELVQGDVIFIDKQVLEHLSNNIQQLVLKNQHILIDANEAQKSYTALTPLIEQLIGNRFRKHNRLIAIGGGITQDITAFMASMMYRGVEWIFFPTTLLAQADSCIGGKTSINIGKYKNQLGNFYPPKKIFIIPEFMKTLPELDFRSGMGEMLHFYLVSGIADYEFYKLTFDDAFVDKSALLSLVKRNLGIKKDIIERDEFDRGERQLLNYGHSFGHALETLTNYSIPHGIAVSFGMDISNFISVKLNFLDEQVRLDIRQVLEKIWSGVNVPSVDLTQYEIALSRDKKNIGNTYQVILTKGIGKMVKHGINPNPGFTSWLQEYFEISGIKIK